MNGTDAVIRASTGIHLVDVQSAIISSTFRRKNKYKWLTICLLAGYEADITNFSFNWRRFGHQRVLLGINSADYDYTKGLARNKN